MNNNAPYNKFLKFIFDVNTITEIYTSEEINGGKQKEVVLC